MGHTCWEGGTLGVLLTYWKDDEEVTSLRLVWFNANYISFSQHVCGSISRCIDCCPKLLNCSHHLLRLCLHVLFKRLAKDGKHIGKS